MARKALGAPPKGAYTQQGPYTVEENDRSRDLWGIRTGHGLVISPIYGRGTASLMASAPELLWSLVAAVRYIEGLPVEAQSSAPDNWRDLLDRARAAIRMAKA